MSPCCRLAVGALRYLCRAPEHASDGNLVMLQQQAPASDAAIAAPHPTVLPYLRTPPVRGEAWLTLQIVEIKLRIFG